MRNISFSLTTPQIRARTKTVTRRLGWKFAKAGDVYCAIEKGQGLKKGEKVMRLCQIRVKDVRQEVLALLTLDLDYGFQETTNEGFPEGTDKHWPSEFVRMFCAHNNISPHTEITRIEFEYV